MDIFTNSDIDFSKDFYKYLEESYDKSVQEIKLKDKNNKIIKENMAKLEECIKSNLANDNTQPYDKTFICEGFQKLKLNNNDTVNLDLSDNLKPFYNPMEKLKVYPAVIHEADVDFYPNYLGKQHCGDYVFSADVIPKNSFAWFNSNATLMIVRMSNIKSDVESKKSKSIRYPIYWS
jgi:hypothetical protein